MATPLDRLKANRAAAAEKATDERGEPTEQAMAKFHEACGRYHAEVLKGDFAGLDIVTFDSTIGQQEYAGKVFGAGGSFASPASVAMIFREDDTYWLLNDGGAGGVMHLPAGGQFDYPVQVLPVDRGEEEIFDSHLPSGDRRRKWQTFDEPRFRRNNTPRDIERAVSRIESEISTLKIAASHPTESDE